ncbi:hypothetical protein OAA80_00820 [Amylibacter sp.]|nr:hypothetical protein [Amylibacter sp.]
MNKIKLLVCSVFSLIFLFGCDSILEPVSIYVKNGVESQAEQEKFSINIIPLTFSNAKIANKDPYSRKLMRTGSGSHANVISEANILKAKLPSSLKKEKYIIGNGDKISFSLKPEFKSSKTYWPVDSSLKEYFIGIGDELTFIKQLNLVDNISTKNILSTNGIVGSNGNILLLGLGNINVVNRSLADVKTEVRNILIRDGQDPNFQLEITEFKSKKVFLTSNTQKDGIIYINNLPTTLKEVVLGNGISQSAGDSTVITLTRNNKEFQFTAEELLNQSIQNVYIQDGDNIDITSLDTSTINTTQAVDSQGKLLLPILGLIKAKGESLEKLRLKAAQKLVELGLKPSFQLELYKSNSKKAYLNLTTETKIITLEDKNVTLRELVLINNILKAPNGKINLITLHREGEQFQLTGQKLLNPNSRDIWVQDGDQIDLETLEYKAGQVFALSGSGNALIVPINPSVRETLADVLFVPNGALNNSFAKRSDVYLLRGRNPSKAYHLDAQNVSRILVAAQTELRPSDIIFVAERPIISFARTLSEITPLRILLRDIQNNNIP